MGIATCKTAICRAREKEGYGVEARKWPESMRCVYAMPLFTETGVELCFDGMAWCGMGT